MSDYLQLLEDCRLRFVKQLEAYEAQHDCTRKECSIRMGVQYEHLSGISRGEKRLSMRMLVLAVKRMGFNAAYTIGNSGPLFGL